MILSRKNCLRTARQLLAGTAAALAFSPLPAFSEEDSTIKRMLDSYNSIETVTCSTRKTSTAGGQTVRMLSRVHYRRDGFIHVENISPSKRRIIADGKSLYYHDANMKKGFSRTVDQLDETWTDSLNTVPASPMDHLRKLLNMKEGAHSETKEGTSIAFHGEKQHVTITIDKENRIIALAFFKDKDMKERYARYSYSAFIKAGDTWLPTTHKAELVLPDGSEASETRHFDNLSVNVPIPEKLFDYRLFMKDVEFVSDFEDTWQ